MSQDNQRQRVGILVYPGVELLDFCGPYEVFTSVRLNEERRYEESSPLEVLLLSENLEAIKAHNGLRFFPDCALDDCPALDVLTIPGGMGIREAIRNEKLIRWIKERG
ncbi:MAG: DJ-1/PfpI family protein, partial [Candidatus Omnitrophota bacterium]